LAFFAQSMIFWLGRISAGYTSAM